MPCVLSVAFLNVAKQGCAGAGHETFETSLISQSYMHDHGVPTLPTQSAGSQLSAQRTGSAGKSCMLL